MCTIAHSFFIPTTRTTMKKIKFILALSLVTLVAANCNTEKATISDTAFKYLDAMGNYRIADAAPFATKQTQKTTLHYIQNNIMPNVDSNYIRKNTPAKIKIKGIRMVNDTIARVGYHKDTPITHQNDSITMVKRDGKWQANVLIKVPNVLKAMLGDINDSTTNKQTTSKETGLKKLKNLKKANATPKK